MKKHVFFNDDVYNGITQRKHSFTGRTTPMQLRSAGSLDQGTPQASNTRQARDLRKLVINSVEYFKHSNIILDSVIQ